MSLTTPEKVGKLQRTLNAKAKGSPTYRFYALYDKIYREDVLLFAYRICQANGGAAGVDGVTFAEIETYGRDRWLGELAGKAYRSVDAHARERLRQWLCNKHKVPGKGISQFPDEVLHETLGLTRLTERTHNFPWAKA
ncbi:MAG: hypothetical protein WBC70_06020 [Candidatus Aminicenantales bacterium]